MLGTKTGVTCFVHASVESMRTCWAIALWHLFKIKDSARVRDAGIPDGFMSASSPAVNLGEEGDNNSSKSNALHRKEEQAVCWRPSS